jgi:cytochrome c peroxidase
MGRATVAALAFCIPLLIFGEPPVSEAQSIEPGVWLPYNIPGELWSYFVPRHNPLTPDKIELGRRLFFDPRLSADSKVSCATCHEPERAFTDGKISSEGIGGRRGNRNSPTLLNAMFNAAQFHDGRAGSLEEQALEPLINPDELGNASVAEVIARIGSIPEYADLFRKVFGEAPSAWRFGQALASFERTLVSGEAPFDRWSAGDSSALDESAQRGLAVFRGRGRCSVCHTLNSAFPFFSDHTYRNTGVGAVGSEFDALARLAEAAARNGAAVEERKAMGRRTGGSELGRFLVTGHTLDIGAFKTPSLREVELTAPYFHDGSASTLEEVVRSYARGSADKRRDWELQQVFLSPEDQQDLVAFLKALTGTWRRPQTN